MSSVRIIQGETPSALTELSDESVDACVTDPPYGIGFMGKQWDTFKPDVTRALRKRLVKDHTASENPNLKGRTKWAGGAMVEYDYSRKGLRRFQLWTRAWGRAVMRVLKPGAYLLVCGAPRSYHRLTCGLEDAGFEIGDCILWLFGQGYPKSHNLKGEFEGWGTALKPAWEPIVIARKPRQGSIKENMERYGVGALNIDVSRVPVEDDAYAANCSGDRGHEGTRSIDKRGATDLRIGGGGASAAGRWPANVIHDGSAEVLQRFAEFGDDKGALAPVHRRNVDKFRNVFGAFKGDIDEEGSTFHDDLGSAARFFYCAKASRSDRDDGMSGFEKKPLHWSSGDKSPGTFQSEGTDRAARNNHPTVKPTELMRYLCALVTPPGGTVLDPFMGSGSTGRGAVLGGFSFIGIEREGDYVEIARARIRAIDSLFTEIA